MKISIFTPTHRPDHLRAAYASLAAQTFTDWEWVLVPNSANTKHFVDNFMMDPRVRMVYAPAKIGHNIGALKRFACEHCTGDVLVELDHDDWLARTALERIAQEVQTGAGFVFSDFVNFRDDGTCEAYNMAFGWEHYGTTYDGKDYVAHRCFSLTPSSLHLIFYAPNHVRAWTRDAYTKAGGHDAAMRVCDDFDLVCRTYLTGAVFKHIPEPLYFYRLHTDASNSYLRHNAEIQRVQQEVSNKYVYDLVKCWCYREDMCMWDLGGDTNSPDGFHTLNLRGADENYDARNGLPFADNSVGCIRAYDFLEHIPHCANSACLHRGYEDLMHPGFGPREGCVVHLMNEIYRVLVPGGWLISRTPSTAGRGAWQDPTHCSFWNPNSFWYYTRAQQARFVPGITARFQRTRCFEDYPSDWHKEHQILYVHADLVALKGQRQPGICEI